MFKVVCCRIVVRGKGHAPTSDLSAVTIVTVNDDVAGAGAYVSGDTNGNLLLDGDESWIYSAVYTVTSADPDPLVNTVTVTSTDPDGDPVPDATDNHSTDVEHLPVITVDKTGPASALVGDTVTFNFAVSHDSSSDGSPVSNLTVADDFAGPATYVSGDDGDDVLELGETWLFTASYTTTAADPDPLVNTGTATGDDPDGDPVSDTTPIRQTSSPRPRSAISSGMTSMPTASSTLVSPVSTA